MSKKVLVNLDFNGNEIQNVAMQMLATAPTSPTEGQFYYNSTNKKAYQYDGTSWKAFGAEIVVDASFIADSTNPVQSKVIKAELDKKVDKVSGKGLSTNDYTTAEKNKLSGIEAGANKTTVDTALSATSTNPVQNKAVKAELDKKVAAVSGKGLSTNDYTTTEKNKLAGIAEGANKTVVDSTMSDSSTNPVQNKVIKAYVDQSLSDGIAAADAMIYKGTLGTGGTVTALPTTYKTGWTYRVITAGTYAGQKCEIGDLIIALVDRAGSGNANADWTVAQTNIDGAITEINATSPITKSGSGSSRTIAHANSGVTAGSYGLGADITPKFGEKFLVPYLTENATGHTTNASNHSVMIPNNVATTSADGLMSKGDKGSLNTAYNGRVKQETGVIATGNTSVTLEMAHEQDTLISVRAYVGTEEVVVDVDDTGDAGEVVVSIAKPYTSNIDIVMVYADIVNS